MTDCPRKYALIMKEHWQELPTICTGYECSRDQVSERTTKKNEAREHQSMAGFSEAPHFRNHSARRINRFVMQQTRWSPQCAPNCASSRSTAHFATTPWTCRQRPGRNGTSVSSCIAPPLGGTVVFLGCSLGATGGPAHGSKRYAVPTQHFGCRRQSRRFRHQGWATVARRSYFATDQRRLVDGKGKSVHIQVASSFS